jgi:hypothetical protein
MYNGDECSGSEGNCGFPAAAVYFVTLVSVVSFFLLNMFVTILVGQFIDARETFKGRVSVQSIAMFKAVWSQYDDEGTGQIAAYQLVSLLVELDGPLAVLETNNALGGSEQRARALAVMDELGLTDYDGRATFAQVLWQLHERAQSKDIASSDMTILQNMVKEEQACLWNGADDETMTVAHKYATHLIMSQLWRIRYIKDLRQGIIPDYISEQFKPGVMSSDSGKEAAARTLLGVCNTVWTGFADRKVEPASPGLRRLKSLTGVDAYAAHLEIETIE